MGVVLVFVFRGLFCFLFVLVLLVLVCLFVCFVCLFWNVFFFVICCFLLVVSFWVAFVLFCVCWRGLGVALILFFSGLFCLCLFLFLSVPYENHCFPCNSSVSF